MRRWAGVLACAALLTPRGVFAQSDSGASVPDEGERSLERALTRQSIFVLRSGQYEVEPAVEYSYRGTNGLAVVSQSGVTTVAPQEVKQERLETRLTLRAGLSHDSHVELRLPYVFLRNDLSTANQFEATDHRSGAGDVQLGLTKQLAEDRPARPAVLATLNWRAPTGEFRPGQPSPGNGFHALQGALTLAKRQDPLVFFGTASYTAMLERSHSGAEMQPGNAVDLKFGTILAASPRTSIRGGFEMSRSGRTKVDGASVPGSDSMLAMLQLGLATLVSRRTLFDIQLNIGVTRDTPDFGLVVALPIRFQ